MKSKQLKSYNLSPERTYNEVIDAKPYLLFALLMALGFIFVMGSRIISGTALVLIAIFCLALMPSRRLIEFYDDNMIIYNKASKADCYNIYYEDVKSWTYNLGVTYDNVTFILKDGSIQNVDAYSKILFEKRINKYLKNKNIKGESIWKFQKH